MNQSKYLGTWQLIPELSIYQRGEPPGSGLYVISAEGDNINFEISWTDLAEQSHELAFGGPLDGNLHETDAHGVTHVMYEAVDERTLDSTAFADELIVLYARRVASEDGELLAVSQTQPGEQGTVTNFQVYRRQVP